MTKGEVIVLANSIYEIYAEVLGALAQPFKVRMLKAKARNERYEISVIFLRTVLNKCTTLTATDRTSIGEALK